MNSRHHSVTKQCLEEDCLINVVDEHLWCIYCLLWTCIHVYNHKLLINISAFWHSNHFLAIYWIIKNKLSKTLRFYKLTTTQSYSGTVLNTCKHFVQSLSTFRIHVDWAFDSQQLHMQSTCALEATFMFETKEWWRMASLHI